MTRHHRMCKFAPFPDDLDKGMLIRCYSSPTCTESVRKQWDSMTIRVNLVFFRVKKRLARKLSFKID